MRWPFGPPHLTLKPSKKNKTTKNKKKQKPKKTRTKKQKEKTEKQKQKQTKNQHQKQSNNKTKTKQTKQKQKQHKHQKQTQETQETQKHLNLSTPKINKKKPPQKSPKNWEKQAFLTLLELCQTHQKQTTITLKPQKNKPKKNTILPCSKTTHYFS